MNPIEELYLTYTTGMVGLLDQGDIDEIMLRVKTKITLHKDVRDFVKQMKRKQRLYLGKIIIDWVETYRPFTSGRYYWQERKEFHSAFKEAFSDEVFIQINRDRRASKLIETVRKDKDLYHISLFDGTWSRHRDVWARCLRAVFKYNEKNNTFKLSYIELETKKDHFLQVEIFRFLRPIMDQKAEEYCEVPKIIYNAKYKDVVQEALKKKYLYEDNLK